MIDSLYADHQDWLRRYVNRRSGCPHNAADLVHDVYLRLLNRDHLPDIREPRAYLARMAHGLLIDQRRRAEVERAWLATLAVLPAGEAPSAEENALVMEALVRIDAMLDGLKPRPREVFLLARLDGMSYPIIADALGVSLSTVEKDMAQALRHCYQILLG